MCFPLTPLFGVLLGILLLNEKIELNYYWYGIGDVGDYGGKYARLGAITRFHKSFKNLTNPCLGI